MWAPGQPDNTKDCVEMNFGGKLVFTRYVILISSSDANIWNIFLTQTRQIPLDEFESNQCNYDFKCKTFVCTFVNTTFTFNEHACRCDE